MECIDKHKTLSVYRFLWGQHQDKIWGKCFSNHGLLNVKDVTLYICWHENTNFHIPDVDDLSPPSFHLHPIYPFIHPPSPLLCVWLCTMHPNDSPQHVKCVCAWDSLILILFASLHFTMEKPRTFAVSAVDCGTLGGPCATIRTTAAIRGEIIFTACWTAATVWICAHEELFRMKSFPPK